MKVLIVVFVVLAALGSAPALALPGTDPFELQALSRVQWTGDQTTAAVEAARARIQQVVTSLNSALNEADITLQQVVALATSNLTTVVIPANISDLVTACLVAKQDQINNVTRQSALEIISCFTDKIREAQTILRDVIALGVQAAAISSNGVAAVQACPASPMIQRFACITRAVADASAESIRIAGALALNVARATAMVATIQTDLQRCVALKLVAFSLKALQAAADVGLCVVDRL